MSAKKYKVFFHRGDELTVKTKVAKGYAWLDESGLHLEGPGGFAIPSSDLQYAELFRLHGLGRVVQIEYRNGRLFLSVIRAMIGQFAFINFLKTGALQQEVSAAASRNPLGKSD
jgi:hypothetical protein